MTAETLLFRDTADAIKIIAASYAEAICRGKSDMRGIYAREQVEALAKSVGDRLSKEDVEEILRSVMTAACHSLFTALDGGTKMADSVVLRVVDSNGHPLPGNLHYKFIEYLFEIGMRK